MGATSRSGPNNYRLSKLDRDEDMEIYLPVCVEAEKTKFNLLAVWNFYHACKHGRFKGVKGDGALEWEALRYYQPFFSDPCLVAGDWNFGPTFSKAAFIRLADEFGANDMKSLYHHFFVLELGQSNHSTYRSPTGHYHHLDHIFGSKKFYCKLNNLQIVNVDDAILSDHSPVIIDVEI